MLKREKRDGASWAGEEQAGPMQAACARGEKAVGLEAFAG
jgi:hypothetical protein